LIKRWPPASSWSSLRRRSSGAAIPATSPTPMATCGGWPTTPSAGSGQAMMLPKQAPRVASTCSMERCANRRESTLHKGFLIVYLPRAGGMILPGHDCQEGGACQGVTRRKRGRGGWTCGGWLAGIDMKRPCRKRQRARSSVLCSMQDDWFYAADLCLSFRYFRSLRGRWACSIALLNVHARSSEISSTQSHTC